MGTSEEGDGEFIIVGHVELIEARTLAVGCGHGFDRVATGSGQAVREIELLSDGGDRDLAGGVVDFVYADGGETYWSGDLKK